MSKISLEEALAENEALKDTIAIVLAQKNDYRKKLEEVKKQLTKLKEKVNKPESKVFKPKNDQTYYFAYDNGSVMSSVWWNDKDDYTRYIIGNCFENEEEAEFEVEKLKVIAELKRFALEHNEPIDWGDEFQKKLYICYNFVDEIVDFDYWGGWRINDIFFTSEELVKQAIKEIGEYRIKKYYLGVEE